MSCLGPIHSTATACVAPWLFPSSPSPCTTRATLPTAVCARARRGSTETCPTSTGMVMQVRTNVTAFNSPSGEGIDCRISFVQSGEVQASVVLTTTISARSQLRARVMLSLRRRRRTGERSRERHEIEGELGSTLEIWSRYPRERRGPRVGRTRGKFFKPCAGLGAMLYPPLPHSCPFFRHLLPSPPHLEQRDPPPLVEQLTRCDRHEDPQDRTV